MDVDEEGEPTHCSTGLSPPSKKTNQRTANPEHSYTKRSLAFSNLETQEPTANTEQVTNDLKAKLEKEISAVEDIFNSSAPKRLDLMKKMIDQS